MVGNRGVAVGQRVDPNLMAASGLTVELEAKLLEALDDLTMLEAGQSSHWDNIIKRSVPSGDRGDLQLGPRPAAHRATLGPR